MLNNPFTPSEIASAPDDFFGRTKELSEAKRSLATGSVSIQGQIGIGKSSLLARTRLEMEGFQSINTAKSVVAVGHKDILTADDLARVLLEDMIEVDEKHKKVVFKLGGFIEVESNEIYRNYVSGRHTSALLRLLEVEYLNQKRAGRELLIIAIDEADKCPTAIARLIRQITTIAQHNGMKGIRFLLAGAAPYYKQMLAEDAGIGRFIHRTIPLGPMNREEATDLVETKLSLVTVDAANNKIKLSVDQSLVQRIVNLSGGHPHLLQLLGSYLIENENDDPDSALDARDLTSALRRICYINRAQVYDSILHNLQVEGKLDDLRKLLSMAPARFPTQIPQDDAMKAVSSQTLQWMFDNNVLSINSKKSYRLFDEFLRIRLVMDGTEEADQLNEIEQRLLEASWTIPMEQDLL